MVQLNFAVLTLTLLIVLVGRTNAADQNWDWENNAVTQEVPSPTPAPFDAPSSESWVSSNQSTIQNTPGVPQNNTVSTFPASSIPEVTESQPDTTSSTISESGTRQSFGRPDGDEIEDGEDDESNKHVDIVSRYISTGKLIIVAAVISGSLVLLIIGLIVGCYCKRISEVKVQEVNGSVTDRKVSQEMYVVDEEDKDSFMGIPANNQIWKELQVLSSESPVVSANSSEKTPL